MVKMKPFETINHGRKVWCIDLPPSKLGKRRRIFGVNQEELLTKKRLILDEGKQFESELRTLRREERVLILNWRDRLTIEQMETACREFSARLEGAKTARQAAEEYLADQKARQLDPEQKLSPEHVRSLRTRLIPFANEFEKRPLSALTAGEVEKFILGKGGSAPNYFRCLRALFRHSHKNRWLSLNPFDQIDPPAARGGAKPVLTPEQMRALLRAASGLGGHAARPQTLRALVLGGFCGLRTTEVLRAKGSDLDFGAPEIHVGDQKTEHATGIADRYARLEPVAIAWLKHLDLPKGQLVTLTEWELSKERTALLAEMMADESLDEPARLRKWPHNAARRSFGSYHLASFQQADRTAEIMGHTDAKTTKAKYRVARSKAVADAWFALTPESVLASDSVE